MNRIVQKLCSPNVVVSRSYRHTSSNCKLTKPNPTSCVPKPVQPCPEDPCPPGPPCRIEPPTHLPANRVICCPKPHTFRPPCPPEIPICAITCDNRNLFSRKTRKKLSKSTSAQVSGEGCDLCPVGKIICGIEQNEVTLRLEAAEEVRRLEYEEEVLRKKDQKDKCPPPACYQMECYKPCVKATDGNEYQVQSGDVNEICQCGAKSPLCLRDTTECEARPTKYINHCKHIPRTVLEIRPRPPPVESISKPPCRKKDTPGDCVLCNTPKPPSCSSNTTSKQSSPAQCNKSPNQPLPPSKPPICTAPPAQSPICNQPPPEAPSCDRPGNQPTRQQTSSASGTSCPRSCPNGPDWCTNMPKLNKTPDKCREPTLKERLFRRKNKGCEPNDGKRQYHTLAGFKPKNTFHTATKHHNKSLSCIYFNNYFKKPSPATAVTQNRNMSKGGFWRSFENIVSSGETPKISKYNNRNLCVPKPRCANSRLQSCEPPKPPTSKNSRILQINPCAFYKPTGTNNSPCPKKGSTTNSSCQSAEKMKSYPSAKGAQSQQCSCDLKSSCNICPTKDPEPCSQKYTKLINKPGKSVFDGPFVISSKKPPPNNQSLSGLHKPKTPTNGYSKCGPTTQNKSPIQPNSLCGCPTPFNAHSQCGRPTQNKPPSNTHLQCGPPTQNKPSNIHSHCGPPTQNKPPSNTHSQCGPPTQNKPSNIHSQCGPPTKNKPPLNTHSQCGPPMQNKPSNSHSQYGLTVPIKTDSCSQPSQKKPVTDTPQCGPPKQKKSENICGDKSNSCKSPLCEDRPKPQKETPSKPSCSKK